MTIYLSSYLSPIADGREDKEEALVITFCDPIDELWMRKGGKTEIVRYSCSVSIVVWSGRDDRSPNPINQLMAMGIRIIWPGHAEWRLSEIIHR